MSPALAARTATVCVLLVGIANARTDRRPVAVIDLSGESEAAALAITLGNALVGDTQLRPIDDPTLIAEVTGRFEDENQVPVQTAEQSFKSAELQLAQYSFAAAWSDAASGQVSLHRAMPTTRTVNLYADLVFQAGRARLGENKDAEAGQLFALVHRLSPGRVLDPVRYQAFVIQAFDAAKYTSGGKGRLVVQGTGRIWIDGKSGQRATAELEAGWHVVWVTGPERATKGQRVMVEAGKEVAVDLGDDPADNRTKVRRARIALKLAPDPTARATAMRRISQLLKVRDAVLVSMANGRLIAQTWHERERPEPDGMLPGFSAHRLVEPNKPRELLMPLAPPVTEPPIPETGPLVPLPPPVPEVPWYRRKSVLVSIGAGAIVVAIGSLLIARTISDHVAFDPNPSID